MVSILLLYFVVQGAGEAAADNKTVPGGKSSWECVAIGGERVANEDMFFPGPDYCTTCKCVKGKPTMCQSVLCQPPQNCMSFRLGKTCCDFICLDEMLPKLPDASSPSTDLGLRMVASAVTAILSLALLLFLIHRLRQRKLRAFTAQQQYYEDQLDSPIGGNTDSCHNNACCHNAAYCNGNDHVNFFLEGHTPPYSLWKPPYYFPREDAPPPYSEVVSSNSYRVAESSTSYPGVGPLMVQLGPAAGESSSDTHEGGGAFALIGAIGGTLTSPSNSTHPSSSSSFRATANPTKHWEVPLRSDEVYEEIDLTPTEDLPPPYYPPAQCGNNLDHNVEAPPRETTHNNHDDMHCEEGFQAQMDADPIFCGPEQRTSGPSGGSGNNNMELTTTAAAAAASVVVPPPRLRSKERHRSTSQREGSGHTAAMEQFQIRLSMDMSDSSSSSDIPTRTFSSSSEDSTSMDMTSEVQ